VAPRQMRAIMTRSYGGACLAALSDARLESARGLAEMPAIRLTTLAT
jgi:hypothetical protein